MRRLVVIVTHYIVLVIVADVDVIMPRVGVLVNLGVQSVLRDDKADIIPIRGVGCWEGEATHDLDGLAVTVWTL